MFSFFILFFFFKQKTAYEMRISDWSSDVCSSDLWQRADDHSELALKIDLIVGRWKANDTVGRKEPMRHTLVHQRLVRPDIGYTERHGGERSEEHTSELQSLMRISYAVFCLKKNTQLIKKRHKIKIKKSKTISNKIHKPC